MDKKEKITLTVWEKEQRTANIIISSVSGIALAGLALGLQFLIFRIPSVPSHDTFSFTLIPEILASLAFGPIVGVGVVGIKLISFFFITGCAKITILDNFIIEGSIVFIVGLAYYLLKLSYTKKFQKHRSIKIKWKQWIIAIIIASIVGFGVVYLSRVYLIYPLTEKYIGLSEAQIISSYSYINSEVKTISYGVLVYDAVVQFVKTIVLGIASICIYYFASPLLKRL